MNMKKSRLTCSTLIIGLAALSLGACQKNETTDYMAEVTARWQPIRVVPENHVEIVAFEHIVAYPVSAAEAGDAERRRLHDFILSSNLTIYDTVILEGAQSVSGSYSQLTNARLDTLANDLAELGLPTYIAAATTASPSRGTDQIAILVTRAVAVPPDCSIPVRAPGERPDYEMGCSNSGALGLMVANPNDLNKGRTLSPADGEKASLAMQRYRTGDVEPLSTEETQ